MDRLNIMEGLGHWPAQEDFNFLQDVLKEGIQKTNLARKYDGKDSFIIDGCAVNWQVGLSDYIIDEGWFCYKGEPVKVDAHLSPYNAAGTYRWVLKESNTGDPVLYEDGNNVYLYKKRRMVYEQETNPVQADSVLAGDVFRLYNEKFADLTLINGWAHDAALQSYHGNTFNNVQIKRVGNKVSLQGIAKAGVGGATYIIAQLAEKYRPSKPVLLPIITETATDCELLIEPNGDVILLAKGTQLQANPTHVNSAQDARISFGGVSYEL